MTSTSDEPEETRIPPQHSLSDPPTTNDALCHLCFEALTINDQLAGGTVMEASHEGKAALDLSGFTVMEWNRPPMQPGFLSRRRQNLDPVDFGWRLRYLDPGYMSHCRDVCASNRHTRSATPPTLPELAGSANEDCPFCSRLRELFYERYGETLWWELAGSTLYFYIEYEWEESRGKATGGEEDAKFEYEQHLICLAVIVNHPGLEHDEVDVFEFDVGAMPGNCRDWLKIERNPLGIDGPASERNIQLMKSCIDTCISDHEICRAKLSKKDSVPTRLLDIGDDNAFYTRLLEHSEISTVRSPGSQLKYATLSYCWGDSLQLKTTNESIEEHKKGISIHDMPAVFQDAIHVISKLGIRYLWIDALCIIQDSKEDWETESVRMSDIFAHSFVTISAAASPSCSEGFLQRPAPRMVTLPFSSSLRPDISGEYAVLLDGRFHGPENNDFKYSRWNQRGWIWQEQVMASRQLIFGERMLQYRCNGEIHLENGLRTSDGFMELRRDSESDWFWFKAIAIYSERKLTVAQDRLGAISGAAKFMHDSLNEAGRPTEYLVGLWLDDSFDSLLRWVCNKPILSYSKMLESLLNEEEYIAPSWSWASRNTGVDCLSFGTNTVFQVISYDLRPAHSDAMVAVKFGSSITLQGKLQRTPVAPSCGTFVSNAYRWPNYWTTSGTSSHIRFWLDWVPDKDDPQEISRQNQLQLFLTMTLIRSDGQSSAGLLLLPFEGSQVTLYRRVGAFEGYGDSKWLTDNPEERSVTIL